MNPLTNYGYIAKLSNLSISGINEIKLDTTVLSSWFEVDGYDLIRLDYTVRNGGVACFIKSLISYSYQEFMWQ